MRWLVLCTWTLHKCHIAWKFERKSRHACASLRSRNAHRFISQEPFCMANYLPDAHPIGPVFCASLRSRKCTWTCYKSHFVWKCNVATLTTLIGENSLRDEWMTNVKCHREGLQLFQTIPQTIANIACEIAEGRTMNFNIRVSFESTYHLVAKRCYDSGYPACVARLPELDVHDISWP